jgi:hypothetical protein
MHPCYGTVTSFRLWKEYLDEADMNRRLCFPLLAVLLTATLAWPLWASAAAPTPEVVPGQRVELRGTGVATPSRIVRPRTRSAQAATFVVNYDAGFQANPQAMAAFQHAVDIWASQITSSVPIVVEASFEALGENVLGSAGSTYGIRDWPGAPIPGTFYQAALANKLAGTDLGPGTTDIEASFSSEASWYYGLDANPDFSQYDFVSVALHELGHGLGFGGTASVSGGIGTWGSNGRPRIYDRFVQNGLGQTLISLPSGTVALGALLTGNSLFWNGANAVAANGGAMPRMYAPASWDQGSSFSHLDESTYGAGNANSLMTPAIGQAEAIHDPGPIARGMFTDMGWTTSGSQTGPTATPTRTPTTTPTTTPTAVASPSPTATPGPDEPTPEPPLPGTSRLLLPVSLRGDSTRP